MKSFISKCNATSFQMNIFHKDLLIAQFTQRQYVALNFVNDRTLIMVGMSGTHSCWRTVLMTSY